MNTSFTINCSGWQDPDQPLTYEFSYINYEHESVFYVSREPFAPSVVLPMGHENDEFNLTLNIQITDRLGASAIQKMKIKVGIERCYTETCLVRNLISASCRVVGKDASLWHAFHNNSYVFRHSY